MLGLKQDIDSLVHLLLGALAQGQEFYDTQIEEIKNFFGEEDTYKAERILKSTRLYEIFTSVN